MSGLQFGVVRYAAVAATIGARLGVEPAPDCRIGHGRLTITFRRLGGTRWPEERQIEHALATAAVARAVLAADHRREVRQRAERAIVVVYDDATLVRGCAVEARWECVVPATVALPRA